MTTLPFIKQPSSLTVSFLTGNRTIFATNPLWSEAIEALKVQDFSKLEELMTPALAIKKWTEGLFTITEDGVFYRDERLPPVLERRIIEFWMEGLPFRPLLNFWSRLQANPSNRAVQELYGFLEHKNMPINAKGFIVAYKAVRADYMDIYSGKCYNGIGRTLEMPRRNVDDVASRTCSHGYHAGSLQYVKMYGGFSSNDVGPHDGTHRNRILIVEIDPADVVSIPTDHNAQKMRTCRYTVIGEYTGPLPDTLWSPSHDESFDEAWDVDEEEEMTADEIFESRLEDGLCPYCNDEVDSYWEYCPACGGSLEERDEKRDLFGYEIPF